jgi:hypothetical protein
LTKRVLGERLRELVMHTPCNQLETAIDMEAEFLAEAFEEKDSEVRFAIVAGGLIVFMLAGILFW